MRVFFPNYYCDNQLGFLEVKSQKHGVPLTLGSPPEDQIYLATLSLSNSSPNLLLGQVSTPSKGRLSVFPSLSRVEGGVVCPLMSIPQWI